MDSAYRGGIRGTTEGGGGKSSWRTAEVRLIAQTPHSEWLPQRLSGGNGTIAGSCRTFAIFLGDEFVDRFLKLRQEVFVRFAATVFVGSRRRYDHALSFEQSHGSLDGSARHAREIDEMLDGECAPGAVGALHQQERVK